MSDWTTYKKALSETTDEIRTIIQSEDIAVVIDSVELSTDRAVNRQELLVVISDFLLNLINETVLDSTLLKYLDSQNLSEIKDRILTLKTGNTSASTQSPVNPVRTMASDMQTARGEQMYSSNQDALLQVNQTPTDPDVARWQQTQ